MHAKAGGSKGLFNSCLSGSKLGGGTAPVYIGHYESADSTESTSAHNPDTCPSLPTDREEEIQETILVVLACKERKSQLYYTGLRGRDYIQELLNYNNQYCIIWFIHPPYIACTRQMRSLRRGRIAKGDL